MINQVHMKCLLSIVLFCISAGASAQQDPDVRWSVEGKIINSKNKEPVTARIVYESLPYGGSIGFLNGDTFSFYIPQESAYRLRIEAEGYIPYSYDVKPDEFIEGMYSTLIELVPTGVNELIRLERLIFDLGKAQIREQSYEELDIVANMLIQNPKMTIQLEGHTDYRGDAQQNMRLSHERVEAVKTYLISRGIEKRRIKTKAFGGTQPLTRNEDPNSRHRNRRVDVRILSNN